MSMMVVKIIILLFVSKICVGIIDEMEKEEIESLKKIKNLQILGNSIVIAKKNGTKPPNGNFDILDEYIQSRVIRVKSPLEENKYYDFEISDLISHVEGRKKKDRIRDALLPLFLALKHKAVAIFVMMATIAFIAFKGFWAGMSALIISKIIGLKLLADAYYKYNEENVENEEEQNQQQNIIELGQQGWQKRNDQAKPLVFHLSSYKKWPKFNNKYESPLFYKGFYSSNYWNSKSLN